MDESLLTWNFPNWITVSLMAIVLYLAVALASRLVSARAAGAEA
jgi:predicted membrane-bound dolichyl-phosphate-mannose-protein mannosyltransferase